MASSKHSASDLNAHQTRTKLMVAAAMEAGRAIMEIYAGVIEAQEKSDGSPVTRADQLAEDIILGRLKKTGIAVLAEESVAAGRIPELGKRFFVVDPLDGTKEFIKRNGQFTVNIALVENGIPVQGVVLAPALDQLFVGDFTGAFEYATSSGRTKNKMPLQVCADGPLKIMASRSHGHSGLDELCRSLEVKKRLAVGSSLKFCLLARGEAALYPRISPTCEWDTAAGQGVLEAAGGVVLTLAGTPMRYGKNLKNHLNPSFVAAASEELARRAIGRMGKLC